MVTQWAGTLLGAGLPSGALSRSSLQLLGLFGAKRLGASDGGLGEGWEQVWGQVGGGMQQKAGTLGSNMRR